MGLVNSEDLKPKSNICDAICFVLGRTSAKSLRAERLHELIFHGGNGKAPAQYASVALYLDNSVKIFPFEDEEVSIIRKVNRKGVCVYKIQGKTTTREKVLELLGSARIYPDGHNIILQGDVTNIIEMNPIERRQIIDEISGIAEYNEKKEKAKRDLDFVDSKLKEAEIIITERYDIFKRLEEERNSALRYQNLQNQLVFLKASLAYSKIVKAEKSIQEINSEIEKKEAESQRLQAEIEEVEKELEKREKNLEDVAKKLLELSKRFKIEKELSDLRTKILLSKDRINFNKSEIQRIETLVKRLESLETGVPRAVKAILNQKIKGVFGTVADIIKVPERYRAAIEAALGPRLNDIVVDSDETAKLCIEFLKKEKIGRATFLPLNRIKAGSMKEIRKKGIVGIASKLISFDPKFSNIINFLLGNTLVVESLEIAKTIRNFRVVTLEGDLIERSGVISGGYFEKAPSAKISQEVEQYERKKKELSQEVENLTKQIDGLEKRLKELSKTEEMKEILDFEKIKIDKERELDKLRNRRKVAYERKLTLQDEINRLSIRKAKIEAELEQAKLESLQYREVKPIEKPVKFLEREIKNVQQELLSLGPVNFKAIEQYEKFKSEFDSYRKKYEKILEEKKAVLEMIEKIEEKRREVFNKCLKEVGMHFNQMFNRMTKGTASLELENPLDLESGLIIQANPGGKTSLNIDSLSGGEKTLTALAFLFAIQKYKPAPFYILDEIDAALDKENTKKVAELIKSLSKEEQFVVITHNDQTIKYGDVVYGVTLQQGESKILGLEMPT